MWVRIGLALTLLISQFAPITSAQAVEPLAPILSCNPDSNFACIQKINVITSEGEKLSTQISGTRVFESRTYAPSSVLSANWQVYEVPAIKFSEGTGGQFLIRPFYFPYGNLDCFFTPCISNNEYLEFAVGPITHGIKSNFEDLGYSYEIFFQVPDDFLMTATTGRGMRTLEISESIQNELSLKPGFKNYRMRIEPMVYSSFEIKELLKGILVDKASEESDNGAVWFWGSKDFRIQSFGECKNIEAINVTGNAFDLYTPTWNEQTKSVEVGTSAPHYKSDGSLNTGYFQAKITTAMAKCLWGVDLKTAVEANISLNYGTGEKVQIETWNGKLVGNEYVLTASGFHFSSPRLSFKLIEKVKSPASPSPSASPQISLSPQAIKAKKSITCTKGKIIKRVTAFSPKCPVGYKIKY